MHHIKNNKIHFQCIVHFISRNVKQWFSRKSSGAVGYIGVHTWVGETWEKGSLFTVERLMRVLCCGVWKCWFWIKRGVFKKKILASLGGGQIWCETVQNPCLGVFYWRKLKLVWSIFKTYVSCVHHKIWKTPNILSKLMFSNPKLLSSWEWRSC